MVGVWASCSAGLLWCRFWLSSVSLVSYFGVCVLLMVLGCWWLWFWLMVGFMVFLVNSVDFSFLFSFVIICGLLVGVLITSCLFRMFGVVDYGVYFAYMVVIWWLFAVLDVSWLL